jgi:hypothetical protein
MSTLTEEIFNDLNQLPIEMQTQALDFIRFLKAKLAKNRMQPLELSPNGSLIAQMLEQAAQKNLFSHINDPAAWQREIRQDRPLVGRE